jgi:hypothetical protein
LTCFARLYHFLSQGSTFYTSSLETVHECSHPSRIKIVLEKGPARRAMIEGFSEPVHYGVHGGIMKFYKVEPEKEHAATLDHIVAATAG